MSNYEIQELDRKIDNLESKIDYSVTPQLNNIDKKFDETLMTFSNMQVMLNGMINIMNLQSSTINQLTQKIQTFEAKLSDIEIMNQNNDISISDIQQTQQQVLNTIEEVKHAIENIKFPYFD